MGDRAIDILCAETHAGDPFPTYAWLREQAPLYWDAKNELWVVSRYDDIVRVSRDVDTFTSAEGNRPNLPPDPSFINQDGARHRDYRGLIAKVFGGPSISAMEGHVDALVTRYLDDVIEDGRCELVQALAGRLPLRLIGELCGHDEADDPALQGWLDGFALAGCGPEWVTDERNEAFFGFAAYHEALVEARRADPKEDLISLWLAADGVGLPYEPDQLLFEHTMVTFGGSETTRNAIAGGVHALLEHPDQLAWLRAHPEGLPNAVEEIVRWVTPFVNMCRRVTRPVEMHGHSMLPGQCVLLLYPAANRDPRHFPDPDRFDIRRQFTSKILSFGYGPHFCLGAHLARLEIRLALRQILERLQDLELEQPPQMWQGSFVRGPKDLFVRFRPGTRVGAPATRIVVPAPEVDAPPVAAAASR
jgi:cytochrome P450 family 142 subfamily A polypeptide 1